MSKLIILGSSYSIPDASHDVTHMVLVGESSKILIDCGNNPLVKLTQKGVGVLELSGIILTHFHPDHVSGLPLLLMDMWLMGRKKTLDIYGLDDTINRIESAMRLHGWENWPDFYPITFHRISTGELVPVVDNMDFLIRSSTVDHMIPCIGLRVECRSTGKVLAYSSDTEPCNQVIRLADQADLLFHEATGHLHGHSSAMQAGEIASKAGVKELYLIHYPTGGNSKNGLIPDATSHFKGPVHLAEDLLTLDL